MEIIIRRFFLLTAGYLCTVAASAQITIGQTDMPQPGDTYITTNAVIDPGIDLSDTGIDYTWDFQQLLPLSSATDTFYNMSSVSLLYQLLFSGANLAGKSAFSIAIDQLTLDDVYLFYKNSTSAFEQFGFAGTFDGIPVPIIYGSNDFVYRFPMTYGTVDSSSSDFSLGLAGVGYVSQQRKRVNAVDGWGTIKTPAGIFETIRVVSTINDVDSVFIDTLNYGTNVTLKSYEYKWLAAGSGTPVFQINAQDVLGLPVITQISYQDTTLQTGWSEPQDVFSLPVSMYPNPVTDILIIHTNKGLNPAMNLRVTDLSGKLLLHCNIAAPHTFLNFAGWENGLYILHFTEGKKTWRTGLIVQH